MNEPEQISMAFYEESDVTRGMPWDEERKALLMVLFAHQVELDSHEYAQFKMHPFIAWPGYLQEKLRPYGAEGITTSRVRST